MRFVKRPIEIEAITFTELVAHGLKDCGSHKQNGMPWSFSYKGQPITHETDDCYLVPTSEGTMRFERGDVLITGVKGEIYPCKWDIFCATYEPVSQSESERKRLRCQLGMDGEKPQAGWDLKGLET